MIVVALDDVVYRSIRSLVVDKVKQEVTPRDKENLARPGVNSISVDSILRQIVTLSLGLIKQVSKRAVVDTPHHINRPVIDWPRRSHGMQATC